MTWMAGLSAKFISRTILAGISCVASKTSRVALDEVIAEATPRIVFFEEYCTLLLSR